MESFLTSDTKKYPNLDVSDYKIIIPNEETKQLTAVEWLIEQLELDDSKIARVIGLKKYNQVVSQAKEMEKQQQENFASWCIKKRVDFFDSTEIGETYTIDGFVSRYKMNELLEMYRNTTNRKQDIIDMMRADEELGLYEDTYKSGLEYLISEILHEQETYFDDEGELTDKPIIQYMNSFKSHVDLTKYVEKAREIDSQDVYNEMFDTLKRNSIDNVATITNVDLFIKSWKQEFKKK